MDTQEQNKLLQSVKDDLSASRERSDEAVSYFIIGLSLAVIASIIFLLTYTSSKKSQIETYDEQIKNEVTTPLKTLEKEEGELSNISSQIDLLAASLSKRTKYSAILSDLAANQYKKSRWTGFNIKDGNLIIKGQADNFIDVAKSITAMKRLNSIKSIKLTNVNLDQDSKKIDFTVEAKADLKSYAFLPAKQSSPTVTPDETLMEQSL